MYFKLLYAHAVPRIATVVRCTYVSDSASIFAVSVILLECYPTLFYSHRSRSQQLEAGDSSTRGAPRRDGSCGAPAVGPGEFHPRVGGSFSGPDPMVAQSPLQNFPGY